jgi:hypothetical protein
LRRKAQVTGHCFHHISSMDIRNELKILHRPEARESVQNAGKD